MKIRLRDIKGFEDKDVVWSERSIGLNEDKLDDIICEYASGRGLPSRLRDNLRKAIISNLPLLIEGMA